MMPAYAMIGIALMVVMLVIGVAIVALGVASMIDHSRYRVEPVLAAWLFGQRNRTTTNAVAAPAVWDAQRDGALRDSPPVGSIPTKDYGSAKPPCGEA